MPRITAPTLEEHRSLTTEAVLTAFDAVIAERGYDATSMSEVARRAGVGRTALYNYAPDKAALLGEAWDRATRPMRLEVAAMAADAAVAPARRLDGVIRLILDSFATSPQQQRLMRDVSGSLIKREVDDAIAPFLADIQHDLEVVVGDGLAAGAFAWRGDTGVLVDLLHGLLEAAARRIVHAPDEAPAVIAGVVAFVGGGIAAGRNVS